MVTIEAQAIGLEREKKITFVPVMIIERILRG